MPEDRPRVNHFMKHRTVVKIKSFLEGIDTAVERSRKVMTVNKTRR